MSLASPYSEVYYAADGVTTSFAFGQNFTALNQTDVKCIIYFEDGTSCVPTFNVDVTTGYITIITLTKPDGTVLTVPPVGSTVRVFRDTPEAQNITASQLQNYTAKQLEKIFDAIVAMIQENTYTTEHKTVRLTETQRDVFLAFLKEANDGALLYWDNETKTIRPTEFPQTDVVRCVGGLFFRVVTRGLRSYLQWSRDQIEWYDIDLDLDSAFDNVTITKNASNKWEATATVNHNSEVGAVNPVYDWVGTTAEYEAQDIANEHPNWLCFITDDSGAGNITAADVSYDNPDYPTVKAALDELLYVMPSVTITGGGNYEIGSTQSSTTLTWVWNKTIVSQSLNQGIGGLAPSVRSYTYSTPITTDTTFTITGSDGTNSKSASTSVKFMPKRYWGVSTETSLTDAQIIALSSELSTSRQQKRTFNCSGGKYFYFAIKTSYCSGIQFKVGGLAFSDMVVTTRQFTNESGHADSYNIYRVNNIQTGSAIEVEVL